MQHKIRKGNHRSSGSWFPRFHFGKKRHGSKCNFMHGARYDFGDDPDQFDINKLFGLSFGMHHKNSARFGWRWNIKNEMIEILAYVYVDGKRVTEQDADLHIGFIYPGVPYEYDIVVTEDYYVFTLESKLFPDITTVKIKHNGDLPKWGYKLFPYFGGQKVAPYPVWIEMT